MPSSYTYTWGGETETYLVDFKSPDGSIPHLVPGRQFTTTEPVNIPEALEKISPPVPPAGPPVTAPPVVPAPPTPPPTSVSALTDTPPEGGTQ